MSKRSSSVTKKSSKKTFVPLFPNDALDIGDENLSYSEEVNKGNPKTIDFKKINGAIQQIDLSETQKVASVTNFKRKSGEKNLLNLLKISEEKRNVALEGALHAFFHDIISRASSKWNELMKSLENEIRNCQDPFDLLKQYENDLRNVSINPLPADKYIFKILLLTSLKDKVKADDFSNIEMRILMQAQLRLIGNVAKDFDQNNLSQAKSLQKKCLKNLEEKTKSAQKIHEEQLRQASLGAINPAMTQPYIGDAVADLSKAAKAAGVDLSILSEVNLSRLQFGAIEKILAVISHKPSEGKATKKADIFMPTGFGKTFLQGILEKICSQQGIEIANVNLLTSNDDFEKCFFGNSDKKYLFNIDELYYLGNLREFFTTKYNEIHHDAKIDPKKSQDDEITLYKFIEDTLYDLRKKGHRVVSWGASINISQQEEKSQHRQNRSKEKPPLSKARREEIGLAKRKQNDALDILCGSEKKWRESYRDISELVEENPIENSNRNIHKRSLVLPNATLNVSKRKENDRLQYGSQKLNDGGTGEEETQNDNFITEDKLRKIIGTSTKRAVIFPIIEFSGESPNSKQRIIYGVARINTDGDFEVKYCEDGKGLEPLIKGKTDLISIFDSNNSIGGDYESASRNVDQLVICLDFGKNKKPRLSSDLLMQYVGRNRGKMPDNVKFVMGGEKFSEKSDDTSRVKFDPEEYDDNQPAYVQEILRATRTEEEIRKIAYLSRKKEEETNRNYYQEQEDKRRKIIFGGQLSQEDQTNLASQQYELGTPRNIERASSKDEIVAIKLRRQINELSQEEARLRAELEAWEKRLAELGDITPSAFIAEAEKTKEERDNLRDENEKLRSRISGLENELSELRDKIEAAEKSTKEARDRADEAEKERDAALEDSKKNRNKAKAAEDKARESEDKAKAAENERDAAKEAEDEALARASESDKKADDAEEAKKEAEDRASDADEDAKKSKKEKEEAEKRAKEAEEDAQSLRDEQSELQKQLEEMRRQLEELKKSLAQKEAENKQLSEENERLKKDAAKKDQDIKEGEEKRKNDELENKKAKDEFEEEAKSLREENSNLLNDFKRINEQLAEIKQLFEEEQTRNRKLVDENVRLKQENEELGKSSSQQLRDLKGENEKLKLAQDGLQGKLDTANQTIEDLKGDLEKKDKEIERINLENEELKEKLSKLENDKNALKEDLDATKKEKDEVQKEADDANAKADDAEKRAGDAEEEKEKAQKRAKDAEDRAEDLQKKKDDAEDRANKAREDLQAANGDSDEVNRLRGESAARDLEIEDLKADNSFLKAKIENIKNLEAILARRLEKLEKDNKDREENNTKRDEDEKETKKENDDLKKRNQELEDENNDLKRRFARNQDDDYMTVNTENNEGIYDKPYFSADDEENPYLEIVNDEEEEYDLPDPISSKKSDAASQADSGVESSDEDLNRTSSSGSNSGNRTNDVASQVGSGEDLDRTSSSGSNSSSANAASGANSRNQANQTGGRSITLDDPYGDDRSDSGDSLGGNPDKKFFQDALERAAKIIFNRESGFGQDENGDDEGVGMKNSTLKSIVSALKKAKENTQKNGSLNKALLFKELNQPEKRCFTAFMSVISGEKEFKNKVSGFAFMNEEQESIVLFDKCVDFLLENKKNPVKLRGFNIFAQEELLENSFSYGAKDTRQKLVYDERFSKQGLWGETDIGSFKRFAKNQGEQAFRAVENYAGTEKSYGEGMSNEGYEGDNPSSSPSSPQAKRRLTKDNLSAHESQC